MKESDAMKYCAKCPNFYLYFKMRGDYRSSYNRCWYENVVIGAKCSPPDELDFGGSRKEIHVQIKDSLLAEIENEKAHEFFKNVIEKRIVGAGIMFNQSSLPVQLVPYMDRYLKLSRHCLLDDDNENCHFRTERLVEKWNRDEN